MLSAFNTYLATIESPMHRAKARAALEMQVRANGGEFMFRHELMERRVNAGARIAAFHGEDVLMNKDGSFLDVRNATRHGLNYALWLSGIADANGGQE